MKIEELMMKKRSLPTWEEVEQACMVTSSYKGLEEFFIVYREWEGIFKLLIELFIVNFDTNQYT